MWLACPWPFTERPFRFAELIRIDLDSSLYYVLLKLSLHRHPATLHHRSRVSRDWVVSLTQAAVILAGRAEYAGCSE